MISIKTTLKCAATFDGALLIESNSPFSGVDRLALIVGMADKETHQLPTDLDGLRAVINRLEFLHEDCLEGLQGIGWVLSVTQLDALPEGRAGALGRLIADLAALAATAKGYREAVAKDPRFPLLKT